MHSRIFQFSDQPIHPNDYIREENFYDNFVEEIADYISSDTNRDADIEWLISSLKRYGIIYNEEEESIIFPEDFKIKYFKSRYDKFKELTQKIDLIDFSKDEFVLRELQQLIEDKYGFYIYTYYYYETLDNFIRNLNDVKKYYIGGTIDYHM